LRQGKEEKIYSDAVQAYRIVGPCRMIDALLERLKRRNMRATGEEMLEFVLLREQELYWTQYAISFMKCRCFRPRLRIAWTTRTK
jgi:hypothetical protein